MPLLATHGDLPMQTTAQRREVRMHRFRLQTLLCIRYTSSSRLRPCQALRCGDDPVLVRASQPRQARVVRDLRNLVPSRTSNTRRTPDEGFEQPTGRVYNRNFCAFPSSHRGVDAWSPTSPATNSATCEPGTAHTHKARIAHRKQQICTFVGTHCGVAIDHMHGYPDMFLPAEQTVQSTRCVHDTVHWHWEPTSQQNTKPQTSPA